MNKMKSFALLSIFLLTSFLGGMVSAQNVENADTYLMQKVINQMRESVADIPADIRRVSVYRLNYDSKKFSKQDVNFIKGEIEEVFRSYASLSVVSPPELEPTDNLKVFGRDSTLQISNLKGRSIAESSSSLLINTAEKYAIHALVEITMQKKNIEGYIINIRMIRPRSQEVGWVKSFVSNPLEVKEVIDKGKLAVFRAGVGAFRGESYTISGLTTNSDDLILDFSIALTLRQPVVRDNSSYLGLSFGANMLRSQSNDVYNTTLGSVGMTWVQAFTPKNEDIDDYRLLLMLAGDLKFPVDSNKGTIFVASPGLRFNLTENIGFALVAHGILSGNEIKVEDSDDLITYNRFGYGLQTYIRF